VHAPDGIAVLVRLWTDREVGYACVTHEVDGIARVSRTVAPSGSSLADDHMPDAILAAISAARSGGDGTIDDAAWRRCLAERFGARWKIVKLGVGGERNRRRMVGLLGDVDYAVRDTKP